MMNYFLYIISGGVGELNPECLCWKHQEVRVDPKVIGYSKLVTNDGENNVYKLGKIRGMKIRDLM